METIEISPHHAMSYFEVYFRKRKPANVYNWHNDEKFQENGERLIGEVISSHIQLVRIVGTYDSICLMCPRNKRGQNFVLPEEVCTDYEDDYFDNEFKIARELGIHTLIDKEPITSGEFFRHMRPCYEKIFVENDDSLSKVLSLRQIFWNE